MKAIVLAGGYGTRLRPLTYTCPKPMLPLAGKPVLRHIIEFLAGHGFDEIIVTTNYLRDRVKDHFGDGSRYGVKLKYPLEEEPLGTAGSVKHVSEYLDDTFAIIQGDNITNIDLVKVLEFHKKKGSLATISLIPVDNPCEYGIAELNDEGRVIRFVEKPRPEECFSRLANTGLYILQPQVLDHIPDHCSYDFSKDLFPKLLTLNEKVYGCLVTGFWTDIGRPENYLKANKWLLSRLIKPNISDSADISGAAIKGPVTIEDNVTIERGARITGPAIICEGSRIRSDTRVMANSFLCHGVTVGRGSKVVGSIIFEDTQVGDESNINHSIIGEGCSIGSEASFGRLSVIGAKCRIGDDVKVESGARIWPRIEVESKSTVKGILRYY